MKILAVRKLVKFSVFVDKTWWETACTNRAENKQEFTDLMRQVKEFKEKWLISPDGVI